jgi:hypothetical protein
LAAPNIEAHQPGGTLRHTAFYGTDAADEHLTEREENHE